MRKIKILVPISLMCMISVGCSKSEYSSDSKSDLYAGKVIVLQERSKDYPRTDYEELRERINAPETRASNMEISDFIGYSYGVKEYPLANSLNIGLPVIDVDAYLADNADYYKSVPVKSGRIDFNSFYGFSRYELKMQSTKVVNVSAQLDLEIFKIGAESSYTETFSLEETEKEEKVFGELCIKYNDTKYEMPMTSYIKEEIKDNYLAKSFVKNLHCITPDEFLDVYGGFVLTSFISGGQAVAMYEADYKESTSSQTSADDIENAFNKTISQSVNTSADGDGQSVTVGNGEKKQKKEEEGNTATGFVDVSFSLRTLGGIPAYSQFTIPQSLDDVAFDLSAWSQSLTSTSNLTVVELPEKSLVPVIEFVEEENLRNHLKPYYKEGLSSNPMMSFPEPYIMLQLGLNWDYMMLSADAYLVTRYGNVLLCESYLLSGNLDECIAEVEAAIKASYPYIRIEEHIEDAANTRGSVSVPTEYNNCEFKLSEMRKIVDPNTDKVYLLRETPAGNKYAFTIYEEVVNDYTFQEAFEAMPVADDITLNEVRNEYQLIAL